MPKRKLLFTGDDMMLGVVKLLKDDFEFASPLMPSAKMLRDVDIPCETFGEMVNDQLNAQSATTAGNAIVALASHMPRIHEKAVALLGSSANRLTDGFLGMYYGQFQQFAMTIILLDRVNPDIVMMHNDVEPLTRVIALWARARGKPCLHVPHAVYFDWEKTEPGSDIHDMITASHLAAAGPFQRQWYERRGFPSGNIRETGAPGFDVAIRTAQNRTNACRLLKVDPGKKIVVYNSSWSQTTNLLGCNDGLAEAYIAFFEAARHIMGIDVVVKVHRHAGNLQWHVETAKKAGVSCVIVQQHPGVVLQAADCVIAYGPSTTLLVAAIMGKVPMVIGGGFEQGEVIMTQPTPDSIGKGIVQALSGQAPPIAPVVLKYAGVPDGHAADRVAQYVRDIMS